jgi:hypothetical protein
MNLAAYLLTPFALLLPAANASDDAAQAAPSAVEAQADAPRPEWPEIVYAAPERAPVLTLEGWPIQFASQGFRPDSAFQVRIERQVTIRVAPRARRAQQNMFMGVPNEAIGPRFAERKIGKCLPVAGISGVQPNGGSNLILYLRDRRIISANLERACLARDFYSGFYLARSKDGNLCVDRDKLQSRSGANCKLTRIRQLVQVND